MRYQQGKTQTGGTVEESLKPLTRLPGETERQMKRREANRRYYQRLKQDPARFRRIYFKETEDHGGPEDPGGSMFFNEREPDTEPCPSDTDSLPIHF